MPSKNRFFISVFTNVSPFDRAVKEIRLGLLNDMRKAGNDAKRQLKRITDPWSHDVVWEVHPTGPSAPGPKAQQEVGYEVSTDDDIFNWLDGGTKVRYRWMERNLGPETAARRFSSEPPGTKGAAAWSIRIVKKGRAKKIGNHPKRITARKWLGTLQNANARNIEDVIQKSIKKSVQTAAVKSGFTGTPEEAWLNYLAWKAGELR